MINLSDKKFDEIRQKSDERIRKTLSKKGVDFDKLTPMTDEEFNSADVQQTIRDTINSVTAETQAEIDADITDYENSEEWKNIEAYVFDPNISKEEMLKRHKEIFPDSNLMI